MTTKENVQEYNLFRVNPKKLDDISTLLDELSGNVALDIDVKNIGEIYFLLGAIYERFISDQDRIQSILLLNPLRDVKRFLLLMNLENIFKWE